MIALNELKRNLSLDYQKYKNNINKESLIYTPRIYDNKSNSNPFIFKNNKFSEKNLNVKNFIIHKSIKSEILNSKLKFGLNKEIFLGNLKNIEKKNKNFRSYFLKQNLEKPNFEDDKKIYSSRNLNIKTKILDCNKDIFHSFSKNDHIDSNLLNKNLKKKNEINDFIEKIYQNKNKVQKKMNSNVIKKNLPKKRKTKKRENLLKYVFKKNKKIKNYNLEERKGNNFINKIENIPINTKKEKFQKKNVLNFNSINKNYNIYQKFYEKKKNLKINNEKKKNKEINKKKKLYNERPINKLNKKYKSKKDTLIRHKKTFSSSFVNKGNFNNFLNSPNLLNSKFCSLKDKKKKNKYPKVLKKYEISEKNL